MAASSSSTSTSLSEQAISRVGFYKVGKTLGHGSFGKVKLATHEITGIKVAIKIMNKSKIGTTEMVKKVKREIQILQLLQHPHIVRLYEVIETPTTVLLVMEYLPSGDMFDFIVNRGKLHEEEARQLFQQLISGIAFCHHNGIVHRDLKPENLLLSSDGAIKIADFGLSNVMKDGDFLETSCGSPNYAAPEVIAGNLYAGPEVDIWSAGVILYALLCGSLPFDDESIYKLFKKIKSGQYVIPAHVSDSAQDLIKRMLQVDPMRRIRMNAIRTHPFMCKRLPPYLSLSPHHRMVLNQRNDREIDDEVLTSLLKLDYLKGVDRKLVEFGVQVKDSNKRNNLRIAYDMLLDQKLNRMRIAEQKALALQASEIGTPSLAFSPKLTPASIPAVSENETISNSSTSSTGNDGKGVLLINTINAVTASSNTSAAGIIAAATSKDVVAKKVERPFFLGIQSRRDPSHVMAEVFRALRALRCEWQLINPYRIICRWRPICIDDIYDPYSTRWIYVGLQVYRIQARCYLLDFQRVGGCSSSFAFLKLCTLIINSLKPPSTATTTTVPATNVASSGGTSNINSSSSSSSNSSTDGTSSLPAPLPMPIVSSATVQQSQQIQQEENTRPRTTTS